jgi:putative restriction endonuclease
LINQPQYGYPILLFSEQGASWFFEGAFSVSEILDSYVQLTKLSARSPEPPSTPQEMEYQEGGRKYVSHLMAERNRKAVAAAKSTRPWVCEICSEDFSRRYGLAYIEAHHIVPVSTYSKEYTVKSSDFALLCPNCHTAVHMFMKTEKLDYEDIRKRLSKIEHAGKSAACPSIP